MYPLCLYYIYRAQAGSTKLLFSVAMHFKAMHLDIYKSDTLPIDNLLLNITASWYVIFINIEIKI